jgi:hypothetical protein
MVGGTGSRGRDTGAAVVEGDVGFPAAAADARPRFLGMLLTVRLTLCIITRFHARCVETPLMSSFPGCLGIPAIGVASVDYLIGARRGMLTER